MPDEGVGGAGDALHIGVLEAEGSRRRGGANDAGLVVVLGAPGDEDEEGVVEVAGHEEARAEPDSDLMKKGPGRGTCPKPNSVGEAIKPWRRAPDIREVGANTSRGGWGEVVEGEVGGLFLDELASEGAINGLDDREGGRPSISKRREPSIG